MLCRAAGEKGGTTAVRMHAAANAGFGHTPDPKPLRCSAGRPEGWAAALQAALVQLNMAAAALLARFLPTAAIGAEQVRCSTAGRIVGARWQVLLARFLPTGALCQLRLYRILSSCAFEAKPHAMGVSGLQQVQGCCMLGACSRNVRLLQALLCQQQKRWPAAGRCCWKPKHNL